MAKPSSITIPTEPIGQVDFTEGRLAGKVDRSLFSSFIDLNNLALSRFSPEERRCIGVYACPGNDLDSTSSADVDYAQLLPSLFELEVRDRFVRTRQELALMLGDKVIFN
jgi:5-methyltetrahydropteroyltriglutamate--homocysteine methyltransferase